MRLIELAITAFCAILGFGALFVGNYIEGILLWILPVGYFLFVRIRKARREEADRRAKQQEESDKFWAKERELRTKVAAPLPETHEYVTDRWHAQKKKAADQEAYDRHRAAQMQQMNMMHQNASQVSAAQQQAAMQSRQGWTDPRASYGSDLADNIINLWALNSMMNQPSGVHASTISPSGPPITDAPTSSRVDAPTVSSYFNDSSSSSSSSSSYSSDTSSDSFGGSDTSSDSF